MDITMYCDGGCRGNGKQNAIGGYGIVLLDYKNKRKKEIKYACKNVTNNIMELSAVIEGLKVLKKPCNVEIYTDSRYVVDAFNKDWLKNWKKNGWIKSDGKQVKNLDLWKNLDFLTGFHTCKFYWVKGHNGNEWNERCDYLANLAMDELL